MKQQTFPDKLKKDTEYTFEMHAKHEVISYSKRIRNIHMPLSRIQLH